MKSMKAFQGPALPVTTEGHNAVHAAEVDAKG